MQRFYLDSEMSGEFTENWQVFKSDDFALVDSLTTHFRRAGVEVRKVRDRDGYEDFGAVCVQTDAQTLQSAIVGRVDALRFIRAWQGFCGVPNSPRLWGVHFANYLRERWCIGDVSDIEMLPLVEVAKAGQSFDLRDSLTKTYWIEYLSEFHERREAWHAFEAFNGKVAVIG